MSSYEDAMAEIERALEDVEETGVRTELESIVASLQEMRDAESGEPTDGDVAFADTEIEGAAPTDSNIVELEANLDKLAENAEHASVRQRLEAARGHLADYRLEREGWERPAEDRPGE